MWVSALIKMLQILECDVGPRGRPHGGMYVGTVRAFVGERDAEGDYLLLAPGELWQAGMIGAERAGTGGSDICIYMLVYYIISCTVQEITIRNGTIFTKTG